MYRHVTVLLIAFAVAFAADGKAEQDKKAGKPPAEPPQQPIDPALVKTQIEKALAYYKEALGADKVAVHEAAHFVMVGQGPGKTPAQVATDLESAYVKATKVLELEKEAAAWPGKLVIFLLPDAKNYPRMVRITQRRKADEDECGSHSLQATLAHVVVCPSKTAGDLGMAGTACTQLAGLLAVVKAKTPLPSWLTEGFGRATALYIGPAATLNLERRKALAYLATNKRTANDVFTDKLQGEEFPVLRSSLMDYLAYSGRTAKFVPFLQGFAGDAKKNNGGLDLALRNASFSREELTANWTKYVNGIK
jgi:hypothetical protein